MELLASLREMVNIPEILHFIDNSNNSIFGINYRDESRVSFKLYSEIMDIKELKLFCPNLYESVSKYIPLMQNESNNRRFHIAYKLRNNKIIKYFHFKFRYDVFYFSVPFQGCSYQGASLEEGSSIRPYFYYENNINCFSNNFNVASADVNHVEYAQTNLYKKINIGTSELPYRKFLELSKLAQADANYLESFFKQNIVTSGRYDDNPPTIAVYYYNCLSLLKQI
jgi:hypothetical protein